MKVLIMDAKAAVVHKVGTTDAEEFLYADDTLLVDSHCAHLQVYMDCIHEVGQE